MNEKKRYTIGVLIGGVHTYFPKELMRGIIGAAKELDINVYFFLGTQTEGFFKDILGESPKNTYDYQFNTIHDYTLLGGLDGLIINFGTVGMYLKDTNPENFALKYNSIPTVFLTEMIDVPNCHSLISDNYQGISFVMEHLIQEHHCKKILFVTGPDHNRDAAERKQAYYDIMNKYSFPVTDSMIAKGDYSEFVDRQVEELLVQNPDAEAIVFSNDEMAYAGYKVCARCGLQIGKDILFTGYDDCERAADMIPPLTTVSQDGITMGRMAVYDMVKRFRGIPVESRRVPVSFVQRESCGCKPNLPEKDTPSNLSAEVQKLNRTIARMKQESVLFQRKSWFIPMLARDLNDCVNDEAEFCLQIMQRFKELHTKSAYLFLLETPITYDGESDWVPPDTLYLAAYYRGGRAVSYQIYDRPLIEAKNGLSSVMNDGDRHQFMVFLLFSGEKQYGILACDIEEEDFPFFYVISLQIGLSLRYLEISKIEMAHRREMSHDMEIIRERNRVLGIMSGYDELTGLLNLRGFMERASELCKQGSDKKAYMIYGDLDHLKEINDTWGHPEGNYALKSVATVMKSCLRSSDILARIGGDEFIALVTSDTESFEENFRTRMKLACQELNASSGKPYYIEASLGIINFHLNETTDIQQIIASADKRLYEAKRFRKKSIRREPV